MSKNVDLTKPLSDEDKEYLNSRARGWQVEENDRQFKRGKFAEDFEEEFKPNYTVAPPLVEPGSDADTPPRFVGQRPYGVDRAVWGGSTGVEEQEAYANTAAEPHAEVQSEEQPEEDEEPVTVDDLTVDQLKAELKARDLKTSGDKKELQERLQEAINQE